MSFEAAFSFIALLGMTAVLFAIAFFLFSWAYKEYWRPPDYERLYEVTYWDNAEACEMTTQILARNKKEAAAQVLYLYTENANIRKVEKVI